MNKIKINIKINSNNISTKVNANTLLVDFLRYNLKLTGTHIGCDTSQCGSCIVMVNNKCIKSCSVLLAQCNNSDIKTVEGLGTTDKLLKIQEAFKKNHGLQCGFCTPGILFSALIFCVISPLVMLLNAVATLSLELSFIVSISSTLIVVIP